MSDPAAQIQLAGGDDVVILVLDNAGRENDVIQVKKVAIGGHEICVRFQQRTGFIEMQNTTGIVPIQQCPVGAVDALFPVVLNPVKQNQPSVGS